MQGSEDKLVVPVVAASASAHFPYSRVLRWLLLMAMVATAGSVALRYLRARKAPALRFQTVSIERGPIASKVTASGTVSALLTVQVGSQVSGRIAALYADYNSQVKKGDVIAELDPQLYRAALQQAEASFAVAQANLEHAKIQAFDLARQAARSEELRKKKLIAQADLDSAQATAAAAHMQVSAAEASIRQAAATRHQALVNLTYTTIRSPIDGVVISRSVDVGQTVAASLQAPTLFTIAQDLTQMQVDTNVAESDVGEIRSGMAVTFNVDAYPAQPFAGVVRQVRHAPVRMAVGARPSHILVQFLVEAITLSMLGGFSGVLLGVGVTYGLADRLGWASSVGLDMVALAVGFSALVGIAFGLYPARKAAALEPIEALRFE